MRRVKGCLKLVRGLAKFRNRGKHEADKMMVNAGDFEELSVSCVASETGRKPTKLADRRQLLTLDQLHSSNDIFVSISGLIGT